MIEAIEIDPTAHLRWMLIQPGTERITDILLRQIYAIEQEIAYALPFPDIDETLYQTGKSNITPPVDIDAAYQDWLEGSGDGYL